MKQRPLGSVRTVDEMNDRVARAQAMVGACVVRTSYVTVDYARDERAPGAHGPRQVTDPAEWANLRWRGQGFDWVDHGVELELDDGRTFSVTWDTSTLADGVNIDQRPLIAPEVIDEADVAVWDVSADASWVRQIGRPITDVSLEYFQQPTGLAADPRTPVFWCHAVWVTFGAVSVEMSLGDADAEGRAIPSSDTIMVKPHRI